MIRYDEGLDSEEIANYENKHDITPNEFTDENDHETLKLLDKVCEGVEVPSDEEIEMEMSV